MVPGLVPLGSTWFHDALDALFTAFWLGSCLVPLGSSCERFGFYSTWGWFHDALDALFTAHLLGSGLVPLGSSCKRNGFYSIFLFLLFPFSCALKEVKSFELSAASSWPAVVTMVR